MPRGSNYPKRTPEHFARLRALDKAVSELEALIDEIVPDGRRKSLALTNLEQTELWAAAAIAKDLIVELPPELAALHREIAETGEAPAGSSPDRHAPTGSD